MCGIIGYLGPKNPVEVIFQGLQKLEYRGYDSAGIAVIQDRRFRVRRSEGKLKELGRLLSERPITGQIGIGHTRWATHGRPSETNAHPHLAGKIALVHNGIIENYLELKKSCWPRATNSFPKRIRKLWPTLLISIRKNGIWSRPFKWPFKRSGVPMPWLSSTARNRNG